MDLEALGKAVQKNWLLLGGLAVAVWVLGEKWLYKDRMRSAEAAKEALAMAGWHK